MDDFFAWSVLKDYLYLFPQQNFFHSVRFWNSYHPGNVYGEIKLDTCFIVKQCKIVETAKKVGAKEVSWPMTDGQPMWLTDVGYPTVPQLNQFWENFH